MKYEKDDCLLTKQYSIVVVQDNWRMMYFCKQKDGSMSLAYKEDEIIAKVKYSDTIESLRISNPEYFV